MIALLQRVTGASVTVDQKEIAATGAGLLVLLAVEPDDNEKTCAAMVRKISRYRIFSDDQGKMNLSLLDTNGQLMLVPQFTLAADTGRGLRPSFTSAAHPAEGARLFDIVVKYARELGCVLGTGQFGADMQVSLTNDGPVTFLLKEQAAK
jgi:D-tyrosyl-tRNA(Tyr) deacylase